MSTLKNQKKIHFEPQGNYLLLEECETPEKIGSLYVPSNARKPMNQGIVLKVGSEAGTSYAEGECVIFPLHVEHRMQIDGRWLIVIPASEVMLRDNGYYNSKAPNVE